MTETLEVVDLCLPGLNCPMPVLRLPAYAFGV